MIKKVFFRINAALFFLFTSVCLGQPPGGGGGPCDPCNEQDAICYDPDVCIIPVNDYSGMLLIIGAAVVIGISLYQTQRRKGFFNY